MRPGPRRAGRVLSAHHSGAGRADPSRTRPVGVVPGSSTTRARKAVPALSAGLDRKLAAAAAVFPLQSGDARAGFESSSLSPAPSGSVRHTP